MYMLQHTLDLHPTISAKSVSQMYDAETVASARFMIWSLPRYEEVSKHIYMDGAVAAAAICASVTQSCGRVRAGGRGREGRAR